MRRESSFRLEIDGGVYHSLDEVPPALRTQFDAILADEDGDGIPDVAQQMPSEPIVTRKQPFAVNGQTYESIDDVPAEYRDLLRRRTRWSEDPIVPTSMTGVEPANTASTPAAGSPIVQKKSMSGCSKLLAASLVVDAIVIAIVLYVILR